MSLATQLGPGSSAWYLPVPLGIILIHWWGPRVLLALYVNSVFSTPLWGLPDWRLWPLYAAPETIEVFLSYFLFSKVAGGRCWMPALIDVWKFTVLGVLVPTLVASTYIHLQLAWLGDIPWGRVWPLVFTTWTGDTLGAVVAGSGLLIMGTRWMERQGWSRTRGATLPWLPSFRKRRRAVELAGVFGLMVVVSLFLPLAGYWFAYGLFVVLVALRYGVGAAVAANFWVLAFGMVLPGLSAAVPAVDASASAATIHLGLTVLCITSLTVGRAMSDLKGQVSQRKAAERAVRESEGLLRAVFDSTTDALLVVDAVRRRVTANSTYHGLVGPAPAQSAGWTPSVALAQLLARVRSPEVLEAMLIQPVGPAAEEWHELETTDDRVISHRSTPLLRGGDQVGFIWSLRDVTRQWVSDRERQRLEQQLGQSQKMEAVGLLAGGIAHDFNNLLHAIQGYSELAMEEAPEGQPIREYLDEIRQASTRAGKLVKQLLTFSRRQAVQPETLDLNEVIGTLLGMVRRVLGSHIEVGFVPGGHVKPVRVDRGQVEQILLNLCVNSRDAMPEGGRITIETRQLTFDAAFCRKAPWARPGEFTLVSVRDTGTGIPREIRDRIFEPFFTTKEVGKGTGLGLATVYGIVRQHQGLIDVWSEVGVGTRFDVYFPMAKAEAREGEPREDARPSAGGNETILLAEDEGQVCDIAVRVLSRAGYRVIVARDGDQAVALFEQHQRDIDLALLDMVMPKRTGRGVYEAIRAKDAVLPVIFSSGYTQGALDADGREKIDAPVISKPYSPQALLRAVREALARTRAESGRADAV